MTWVQRCAHPVNSLLLLLLFNLITIHTLLQFSAVNGRLDKVQIGLSHHGHIMRHFIVSAGREEAAITANRFCHDKVAF